MSGITIVLISIQVPDQINTMSSSHLPTPHNPNPTKALWLFSCGAPLEVDMNTHGELAGASSARRRRERRMRAALQLYRQSIAMHLAEALHHSARPKVEEMREQVKADVHYAPR